MLKNVPKELENLTYVCGIDESGRGCLSGPVFAASVILPMDFESELIRDSKKLSEKKRLKAFELIKEVAISWSCHMIEPSVIDEINIQEATYLAMINSVNKLSVTPEHLLVDGDRFTNKLDIPHTCIVKGDDKFLSIASASIIAKVLRDQYMIDLHKQYPKYKWESNKGYGSKEHINTILESGVTEHHRMSFLTKILS